MVDAPLVCLLRRTNVPLPSKTLRDGVRVLMRFKDGCDVISHILLPEWERFRKSDEPDAFVADLLRLLLLLLANDAPGVGVS